MYSVDVYIDDDIAYLVSSGRFDEDGFFDAIRRVWRLSNYYPRMPIVTDSTRDMRKPLGIDFAKNLIALMGEQDGLLGQPWPFAIAANVTGIACYYEALFGLIETVQRLQGHHDFQVQFRHFYTISQARDWVAGFRRET